MHIVDFMLNCMPARVMVPASRRPWRPGVPTGFKRGAYPKIELHRRAHSPELLCDPRELPALVTAERLGVDVPQFALMDVTGLAAFLCDWAQGGR